MSDSEAGSSWIDYFNAFFESEEWASRLNSEKQPELEIFLIERLRKSPEFSTGAEELFTAAANLISGKVPNLISSTPLPGLKSFTPLSPKDEFVVGEAAQLTRRLLEFNGYEILNFDLPIGAVEETDSGFSTNAWSYGAVTKYEDDPMEIDLLNARENISYISDQDFESLFQVSHVHAKAINATTELITSIEKILPRLREVFEINCFANPGAGYPHTRDLVQKYIGSSWTFLRAVAAQSDAIEDHELAILATDVEPFVRLHVARNTKTPIKILETLLNDEIQEIRQEVAKNNISSVSALESLSEDSDPYVRLDVAQNPLTPHAILEVLSKDHANYNGNYFVRQAVASNPNSRVELLQVLANDPDARVRWNVIGNPIFPTMQLIQFFNDSEVSQTAKQTYCSRLDGDPQIFREILTDQSESLVWYQSALAANPNTPLDILESLASIENDLVWLKLKENPSLSDEIRTKIAIFESGN